MTTPTLVDMTEAMRDVVDPAQAERAACMQRARQALLRSFDETFGPYDFAACSEGETQRLVNGGLT